MTNKYCSNCGAKLREGDNFCSKCGVKIESNPGTNSSRKTPSFKYPKKERHSHIVKRNHSGIPVIEFQDLHPNAVWLFFVAGLARTIILVPLFAVTAVIDPLVTVIIFAAYVIILYLISKLIYSNYRFEVNEYSFRKEHGVLHKRTVNIPFEQAQNVNVRQSVLDQFLGLAHVEIETAGDSGASGKMPKGSIGGLQSTAEGYIPGVSPQEAADLRDLILSRVQQTS